MATFQSHTALTDQMVRDGILYTPECIDAFRQCDRIHFTPHPEPYAYSPREIGGMATISSPTVHGPGLEQLAPMILPATAVDANGNNYVPTRVVCDVASGSGYMCAALGKMLRGLRNTTNPAQIEAQKRSKVIGVDIHQGLVDQSIININHCDKTLIADGLVEIYRQDAYRTKLPGAPFSAINTGVCIQFIPLALMAQLEVNGKLILILQMDQYNNQKFFVLTRKAVSKAQVAGTIYENMVDDMDAMFNYALSIQESGRQQDINQFVSTFFDHNFLFDCNYIMAHTDQSCPQHVKAFQVKH